RLLRWRFRRDRPAKDQPRCQRTTLCRTKMQEGYRGSSLILRPTRRKPSLATSLGNEHDEKPRRKDSDQRMVRRRRTIHARTIKACQQDSIPRRKLTQRMGPEKIPHRKN